MHIVYTVIFYCHQIWHYLPIAMKMSMYFGSSIPMLEIYPKETFERKTKNIHIRKQKYWDVISDTETLDASKITKLGDWQENNGPSLRWELWVS